MTTTHWRPQLLWLPMGLLLGGFSGAAVGTSLLLVTAVIDPDPVSGLWGGLGFALVIGLYYGGIAGLMVGLAVGILFVFLVGAQLPRDVARARAFRLGLVLPPAALLTPVVVGGGLDPSSWDLEVLWYLPVLLGASALGGPLARWVAGFTPPRPQEIEA